jgi:hypothetical protein
MRTNIALVAGLAVTAGWYGAAIALGAAVEADGNGGQPAAVSGAQGGTSKVAQPNAGEMAQRAIAWLRTQQDQKTGGWSIREGAPVFPAITGLVLNGMLMEPGVTDQDATVQAGVKFILNNQGPDGGIYDKLLPSYNTAICLSALARVQQPAQVADARARAIEFLKSIQYGEGAMAHEGLAEAAKPVSKDDPYYGGWGYGNRGRPDLSNTSFALEALHAAGVPEDDPVFKRALVFLQRCQMLETAGGKTVNDMAYANGSIQGGFIYATAVNKESGGVGQSFAGEIAESLSGMAGSATTIRLAGKDKEGKAIALSRDVIGERVQAAINAEIDLSRGIVPTEFIIVLGPTGDGKSASEFVVRSNGPAGRMAEVLRETFKSEIGEGSVASTPVDHWRGRVEHRAYGSMGYAGFKSMVYAGLTREDPRVRAALGWIERNYTFSENPGMGTDGYYYFMLMAGRALGASRLDAIGNPSDPSKPRNWREDMIRALAEKQNADGSFRSIDDRWMENDPVLITAYSLIALQSAR